MAGNQWVQDPNDPNRMTYTDETGQVHVAVRDTGAQVHRDKNGNVLDVTFPGYKPTGDATPTVPAKRRGWGERFADSWSEAGQYGTVGVIARNGLYYSGYGKDQVAQMFPNLSEEEQDAKRWELITATQKRMRQEAAARREADPTWKPDRTFVQQVLSGDWIPDLLGQIGGGFGPENAIAPGGNAVRRIGAQGVIGGTANAGSQAADINAGVSDEFDPSQVGMDALVSMAGQGVFETPGALKQFADKYAPKVGLDIVDADGNPLSLTPQQFDAGPPPGQSWKYRDPQTGEWNDVPSAKARESAPQTPAKQYTISPEERADIEGMIKGGASLEDIAKAHPNAVLGQNSANLQWYIRNNGKWKSIRWVSADEAPTNAPSGATEGAGDEIVVTGSKETLKLKPEQAIGPNGERVEVLPERIDDGDGKLYREYRIRNADGDIVAEGELYDNGIVTSSGAKPVDANFVRFAAKGQETLDNLAEGTPVDPTVSVGRRPPDRPFYNPDNFENPTVSKSGRLAYETTAEAKGTRQIYSEFDNGDGTPIEIQLTIGPEGGAILNIETKNIDTASQRVGRMGRQNVQAALEDILEEFPDIKEIKGVRRPDDRTGRVGRTQAVPAKVVERIRQKLAKRQAMEPETAAPEAPTAPKEAAPTEAPDAPDATVMDAEPKANPADTADVDTDDVLARLTSALDNAKKATDEQIAKNAETRKERFKAVGKARATTSGEAGLAAEMSQLKGEFPKVEREPVRWQFEQRELDALFDRVKNDPTLSWGESIRARIGLYKLLDGHPLQANEIALLGRIFPKDFVKAALKLRTKKQKFGDIVGNILNLPRSLMSSFDLSAPFKQAWFFTTRPEFWKALPGMFKQAFSEKTFQDVMTEIRMRPNYERMESSGLAFSDLSNDLLNREEAFMSDYAQRIPGVGKIVRASERGFTGFLNKVRADTFDTLVKAAKAQGRDIDDPDFLKDLSGFINNATGRGSLGKFAEAGPFLNGLFFSPRLISSRLALLNPVYYGTLDPFVRKEAIKQLFATSAMAVIVLNLLDSAGYDVEYDPRSTDFGRVRDGDTRHDVTGGFGQYITLFSRLATNQTKTTAGQIKELGVGYNPETRLSVLGKFGVNKASPIAGFVASYLRGKDPVGKPFEPGVPITKAIVEAPDKSFVETSNEVLKDPVVKMFMPMFLQDVHEVLNEQGPEGLPALLPSFFGNSVYTYNNGPAFDRLGQPNDREGGRTNETFYSGSEENKPVVEEIIRLEGIVGKPLFDGVKKSDIKDFKMTDEQFYNYQYYAGSYIREDLKAVMQTEEWKRATDEEKVAIVKDVVKDQKANARDLLFPKQ